MIAWCTVNFKRRHMTSDSVHKGWTVLLCLRLTSANTAEALQGLCEKIIIPCRKEVGLLWADVLIERPFSPTPACLPENMKISTDTALYLRWVSYPTYVKCLAAFQTKMIVNLNASYKSHLLKNMPWTTVLQF